MTPAEFSSALRVARHYSGSDAGEEAVERLNAAFAALTTERDRLKMLLTIALIAVDMPPAKPDEPWVRLVEAAHSHGRKLQREEDAAALREALKSLQAVTEALEGGFPSDEAAEFPDVPLAEAWKRRCAARAFLAKHPVKP